MQAKRRQPGQGDGPAPANGMIKIEPASARPIHLRPGRSRTGYRLMVVMPLRGSPLLRRIQIHLGTHNIEAGVSKACRYDPDANPA